jgi:glycosyltransferase involved in cell wall biosynthesis
VLSAGRLDRYKRVDDVVRAMATLADRATLVVTGVGPELEPLRELVAAEGLGGSVEVLGGVDEAALRRWQRTATVVVSLSSRESFGLSLAEGIVAGASIVASDIPAHREMAAALGASPVFVAPDATTGDIANALVRALETGRPGPPPRAPRAWTDVARDTIAVYEDALAHPRSRP